MKEKTIIKGKKIKKKIKKKLKKKFKTVFVVKSPQEVQ